MADRSASHDLAAHLRKEPRRLHPVVEIDPAALSLQLRYMVGEGFRRLDEPEAEILGKELGLSQEIRRLVFRPQRSKAQIHLAIIVDSNRTGQAQFDLEAQC